MDVVTAIRIILETRGWQVQVVEAHELGDDLVPVSKKGLLKCVDGRESDHEGEAMHGPKMLGGIYAMASMRGVTDASGLAEIVEEVRKKGYVPSVHGDEGGATDAHGNALPKSMGCGYFKLWKQGKLKGLETPAFDSEQGKAAVEAADGKYENLAGRHYETQVVINLVPNTTLVPRHHDQRFVADGWVLAEFNLDAGAYVTLAASTVEQLSSTCRSARIVVPSVQA